MWGLLRLEISLDLHSFNKNVLSLVGTRFGDSTENKTNESNVFGEIT